MPLCVGADFNLARKRVGRSGLELTTLSLFF
jgi:hypothetical protein